MPNSKKPVVATDDSDAKRFDADIMCNLARVRAAGVVSVMYNTHTGTIHVYKLVDQSKLDAMAELKVYLSRNLDSDMCLGTRIKGTLRKRVDGKGYKIV